MPQLGHSPSGNSATKKWALHPEPCSLNRNGGPYIHKERCFESRWSQLKKVVDETTCIPYPKAYDY